MRDCRGAGEGKLEGGLEEESTEDHEIVAVAVLRLHYLDGLYAGGVHPEGIVWFTCCGVGI